MLRLTLSVLLFGLSLALAPAHALDRGAYHPEPGSAAETWYFEQALHKMRHKRAVVAGLHWLKEQGKYAAEFTEVSDAEAELDSEFHDYTKLHQEREFLHEQNLPEEELIPEVFGKFTLEHVKPAPEGSQPKDPKHPTPGEKFRIWIDLLNRSDDAIEDRTRRQYSLTKRQKIAFLTLFADLLDTGIMRRKEFSAGQLGSEFVEAKIKAHWERLEKIGPRQELLVETLRHFETPVKPGVSLYETLITDLAENRMLPLLRQRGACERYLGPRVPLERYGAATK